MTLDEAVALIEQRFVVGEPIAAGLAVTICCGGMKSENKPHPALCADEATAVRLWLDAALAYGDSVMIDGCGVCNGIGNVPATVLGDAFKACPACAESRRAATLHWRTKPELQRFQMTVAETKGHRLVEDRWAIYSRLLISGSAVKGADAAASGETRPATVSPEPVAAPARSRNRTRRAK